MFWVYILRSADGNYYTGHTDNLERRIGQYQAGECVGYTVTSRRLELVWWQVCATREEALLAERQIESWSHGKKEFMMRGAWIEIGSEASRLAQSESVHPSTGLS
jgi:putative endonuclease